MLTRLTRRETLLDLVRAVHTTREPPRIAQAIVDRAADWIPLTSWAVIAAESDGHQSVFADTGIAPDGVTGDNTLTLAGTAAANSSVAIYDGATKIGTVTANASGAWSFDTVAGAVAETGANTTMIFVPARFATDAIYEAVDAGIETVICIAEGLPAHDMLRVYAYIRPRGVMMLGPNCPGALSPGKANVGIIPAEVFNAGSIGLVSRSGTLTYQIGYELAGLGLGNSTIVGIGGDPIVGSSFIDVLQRFEADPETEMVVMVGEIGGDEEEKAARFIADEMSKPVVAYIAGVTAPPGKKMGHAGAIISGSKGTAAAKIAALEAAGCKVAQNPTEIGGLMAEVVAAL